jgi:hypothetical protein
MAEQDNEAPAGKTLTPAAQRALKEAEIRRQAIAETQADGPRAAKEVGGPRGAEPTRYGDWERGGRAVDF